MWKIMEDREKHREKLNGGRVLGKGERKKESEKQRNMSPCTKWTDKIQTYKGTNNKLQVNENIGIKINYSFTKWWTELF